MAELSATDVAGFTNGRLAADDPNTARFLKAALAVARRAALWHVSPVITNGVVTVDGAGGRALQLPTKKLNDLTALVEDGTNIDPDVLSWSETGLVRKKNRGCWTREFRGVKATITHGYTEDEAADWRHAVLSMTDKMSLQPTPMSGGRSDAELVMKKIDDVQYQWSDSQLVLAAEKALYTVSNIIDWYQLNPVYYL